MAFAILYSCHSARRKQYIAWLATYRIEDISLVGSTNITEAPSLRRVPRGQLSFLLCLFIVLHKLVKLGVFSEMLEHNNRFKTCILNSNTLLGGSIGDEIFVVGQLTGTLLSVV